MKTKALLVLLTLFLGIDAWAQIGSSVYVGGHIRRARPSTITNLRNSGFNNVILFNVNVEESGDLTTDLGGEAGGVICSNGEYVFGAVQPYYVEDVKLLKTEPTGISRIEICIGGWGNQSYRRIKSLIASQGTGKNSILYKNFKALKDAIPEIDAVNNDEEDIYDVSSAVKFHTMMYDLGYKTSLAPYTNKSYWESLATQLNNARPGACDLVMIQCYDGGAYNNPSDWHIGNIPLHAGRTNYQSSMEESVAQMEKWRNEANVTGGFVWVYNDESWSLNSWAVAMNKVFHSHAPETEIVRLYKNKNFDNTADSASLGEGSYTRPALAARGIPAYFAQSARIKPGYKLSLFRTANLTNPPSVFTKDTTTVSRGASMIISPNGVSGLNGKYRIKGRNGLYWDAGTSLVQRTSSEETTQVFELKEITNGVYTVKNESTGLFLSYNTTRKAMYFSAENADDPTQQWIVYNSGEGQLQFILRPKATTIANGSNISGSRLSLVENRRMENSLWQLEDWPPTGIETPPQAYNPSPALPQGEGAVYDLQGRKIMNNSQLKKGIYIFNGKKIIK